MALSTPASDTSLPLPGGPVGEVALPRVKPRGSSLYRDAWRRLVLGLRYNASIPIVLINVATCLRPMK